MLTKEYTDDAERNHHLPRMRHHLQCFRRKRLPSLRLHPYRRRGQTLPCRPACTSPSTPRATSRAEEDDADRPACTSLSTPRATVSAVRTRLHRKADGTG